jgi:hypothetical protein
MLNHAILPVSDVSFLVILNREPSASLQTCLTLSYLIICSNLRLLPPHATIGQKFKFHSSYCAEEGWVPLKSMATDLALRKWNFVNMPTTEEERRKLLEDERAISLSRILDLLHEKWNQSGSLTNSSSSISTTEPAHYQHTHASPSSTKANGSESSSQVQDQEKQEEPQQNQQTKRPKVAPPTQIDPPTPDDEVAWNCIASLQCFGQVLVSLMHLSEVHTPNYGPTDRALAIIHCLQNLKPPLKCHERWEVAQCKTLEELILKKVITVQIVQNPHVPVVVEKELVGAMLRAVTDLITKTGGSSITSGNEFCNNDGKSGDVGGNEGEGMSKVSQEQIIEAVKLLVRKNKGGVNDILRLISQVDKKADRRSRLSGVVQRHDMVTGISGVVVVPAETPPTSSSTPQQAGTPALAPGVLNVAPSGVSNDTASASSDEDMQILEMTSDQPRSTPLPQAQQLAQTPEVISAGIASLQISKPTFEGSTEKLELSNELVSAGSSTGTSPQSSIEIPPYPQRRKRWHLVELWSADNFIAPSRELRNVHSSEAMIAPTSSASNAQTNPSMALTIVADQIASQEVGDLTNFSYPSGIIGGNLDDYLKKIPSEARQEVLLSERYRRHAQLWRERIQMYTAYQKAKAENNIAMADQLEQVLVKLGAVERDNDEDCVIVEG